MEENPILKENKINFNNTTFVKSAPNLNSFLFDKKSVIFLGKSNVGKSSLINKIFNRKGFMKVSQTPGRTRLLNYALVDNKFYFVDAPGYGYFKYRDNFEDMMLEFFSSHKDTCVLAIVLIDSRRLMDEDDRALFNILINNRINYVICYTKSDKLKQKDRYLVNKEIKDLSLNAIVVSSTTNENIDKLKDIISESVL